MRRFFNTACLFLWFLPAGKAQTIIVADSNYFIGLNSQVDDLVVKRDMAALDTLYASDFVFSHGTGKVEGKTGWMATVSKTTYPLRRHDSVRVELHPGITLVKGNMSIQRVDRGNTARYHLRYIRIYALRGYRWQMISHHTTYEQHDP